MKTLSIVIPAYNEGKTIHFILDNNTRLYVFPKVLLPLLFLNPKHITVSYAPG